MPSVLHAASFPEGRITSKRLYARAVAGSRRESQKFVAECRRASSLAALRSIVSATRGSRASLGVQRRGFLLTDGVNNSGFIDPKIASELAVEFGIKVYTIGLGTNGMALSPIGIRNDGTFQYGNIQVEIDEALLQEIAETTGGKYFRATSNTRLEEIYDEINQLEQTDIEEFKYKNYDEKFRPLALIALGLIAFEFLLRHTIFRSFV